MKLSTGIWLVNLSTVFVVAFFGYLNTVHAANTLFVAPGGNDNNTCTDPVLPCASIQGAIAKALSGDTVKVAIGTYTSITSPVISINQNIFLSGGWDLTFDAQSGYSIIDGEDKRVVNIEENIAASIDHFIIQNGTQGLYNAGNTTASHLVVQNNQSDSYCSGVGILNYGTMEIQWSTIRGNICDYGGYGGGIYNWQYGGSLTILHSTISGNQAATGGGVYNHNNLTIINSTISNNTSTFGFSNSGGGGIYNDSSELILKNVTISGNEGAYHGGGIYFFSVYGGSVTLQHTIIAGNTANNEPDCYGSLTSLGYNIVSDTTGCSFSGTAGDQLNVNPMLGPLQDNGGQTYTHWLYEGSSAIDGGNPTGCTNELGSLLTSDQRGYIRPMDGNNDGVSICDIGSYEADPENLPPPSPDSFWYVSKAGNDNSDCHSPATACVSINGAIAKANSGDTVYVSAESYTSANNEIVYIDKGINIYGGWNSDFTEKVSLTIIDGENIRRGVLIDQQLDVKLERFNVQNCRSANRDGAIYSGNGGGIDIGYRTKVVLSDSIVQNNISGEDYASYQNGGGIGMNNYGNLTIINSIIVSNLANGSGGGIYNAGSTITANNSYIAYNGAYDDGGGIGTGIDGQIEINDTDIIGNVSLKGGGGIDSFNGMLVVSDSLIANNTTWSDGGGGIRGSSMEISGSTISNNTASNGGGIRSWYITAIENSAISNNLATNGHGGGIYSGGDLILTNTTIAYNQAIQQNANGGGIYRAGGIIQASNVTIARNLAETGGGIWN